MTLTNGAGWRPIQKTKTSNGARARIFAHIQVGQAGVTRVLRAAPGDALQHAQIIGGRGDHARHGAGDQHLGDGEAAAQDEELADEAVGAGEGERGEAENAEEEREHRHVLADASGGGQVAGMQALVDDADGDEQRPGGYAVVDHHQRGALEAAGVEREDAERGEAHVADA